MKNIILKNGLLTGAIISAVLLIGIALMHGDEPNLVWGQIIGYTGMAIAFFFIIPAVRKANEIKRLNFGRALFIGLQIMLIACAIYSLVWTLYIFAINPDAAKEMGEQYFKGMEAQGAAAEEIAKQRQFMETVYGNPIYCFLVTLMEPIIPGAIFSLIAAAVNHSKNKKNPVRISEDTID